MLAAVLAASFPHLTPLRHVVVATGGFTQWR